MSESKYRPLRPLFARIGGKTLSKKKIVDNYFIKGYENMTYVEPFIGGGSIFFYKKPSVKEVINDLDKTVIDVFKIYKKYDGKDIEDAIDGSWSKEDFLKIKESKPSNDFERGIKELLLSKLSFYSLKKHYTKSRSDINASIGDKYKNRLKDTIILNEDYKDVIKKYDSPNTFFYLDPPYEKSEKLYTHGSLSIREMFDILKNIKGKFLLSYNDSEDAKKLFKNYYINYIPVKYTDTKEGGQPNEVKEMLISNYNPVSTPLKGGSVNLKQHLEGYGEEVKEVEEEPMDDSDIRDNIGQNTKIIKYSDLSKYKSITDLLPRKRDYAILLYLDSPNSGHWTCILRDDYDIYFFCSYGSKIDEPLSWVDCNTRIKLGVAVPFLTRLLNNAKGFNVYYNPIKYQNERDDVNTCGRYCTLLIKQFKKHMHYTLYDFYIYLNKIKSKYNLTYDEIASTLIDE